MADKRQLILNPMDGFDPEIGAWLWAFQDTRRVTLKSIPNKNWSREYPAPV